LQQLKKVQRLEEEEVIDGGRTFLRICAFGNQTSKQKIFFCQL